MSDEKTTQDISGRGFDPAGDISLTEEQELERFANAYRRYGQHLEFTGYAKAWWQSCGLWRLWDDDTFVHVAKAYTSPVRNETEIKTQNPQQLSLL